MNLLDIQTLERLKKEDRRQKGAIRRAKRKLAKLQMASSGWKVFKGEELPQSAIDWISRYEKISDADPHMLMETDIFAHDACWVKDEVYFKGDSPETAEDWIITTDNGGYFKVGAHSMIWYFNSEGGANSTCRWTRKAQKQAINAIISNGVHSIDPNYQT